MPSSRFVDRLIQRTADVGSPVCVGLDPVAGKLPDELRAKFGTDVEAVEAFCLGVIEASAEFAAAFKPQSACFERYGAAGVAACGQVIDAARERDLVVILDAKRGDIGVSAEHYAAATLGGTHPAHWVTVNAYLGDDGLAPFVAAGGGAMVLGRGGGGGGESTRALR